MSLTATTFTENSHSPPSRNQFRTPSSVLLSSSKFYPSPLASRQKPNPTLTAADTLTPKQETFYAKYDSTEGVTTAVVLGGFFVLVCLLVVYKTKLKPLWKERQAGRQDTGDRSELSRDNTHLHKANSGSDLLMN